MRSSYWGEVQKLRNIGDVLSALETLKERKDKMRKTGVLLAVSYTHLDVYKRQAIYLLSISS